MNTWLRDNGLWLTLFAFFVLSEMGRIFSDWRINSTLTAADAAQGNRATPPTLLNPVGGAQWGFEFFQNGQSRLAPMAILIVLTVCLREQGGAESKLSPRRMPRRGTINP